MDCEICGKHSYSIHVMRDHKKVCPDCYIADVRSERKMIQKQNELLIDRCNDLWRVIYERDAEIKKLKNQIEWKNHLIQGRDEINQSNSNLISHLRLQIDDMNEELDALHLADTKFPEGM